MTSRHTTPWLRRYLHFYANRIIKKCILLLPVENCNYLSVCSWSRNNIVHVTVLIKGYSVDKNIRGYKYSSSSTGHWHRNNNKVLLISSVSILPMNRKVEWNHVHYQIKHMQVITLSCFLYLLFKKHFCSLGRRPNWI